MTVEEAKKLLEKEGFYVEKATRPCAISESFIEYEDPTICEAMQVVNSAGYFVCMEMSCFDERKARLKKELAEHSNAPVSGKEKAKEGNPALEEAASQFNDALLNEQAKKIKRLGKEIAKLNSIIHDKNAVLSDVAEELRLSKIREKNLVEISQKYMKENEELKEKFADKVVDKIDAQALKSAESALAYKEKVIARKDMALAYYKKKIAEKDEVIADLTHELKAKHKKYVWYKGAYDAAQQILNTIADYAAKHPDKKFIDQMEVVKPNKLSPFKDDKSYGEVTNQKDISPNLKVTVRLYGKEIEDLCKEIKSLWQE